MLTCGDLRGDLTRIEPEIFSNTIFAEAARSDGTATFGKPGSFVFQNEPVFLFCKKRQTI